MNDIINKNCKICDKSLSKQQLIRKQSYCSVDCRNISNRGKNHYLWKNIKPRFCKNCKKELTREQILGGKKFCSIFCYGKSRQKELLPRNCPICKKSLPRKKLLDDQICCSWECRNKFYVGKKVYCWNYKIKERLCVVCGEKVRRTARKSAKTCSNECKLKYQVGMNNPNYKNGLSKEPYGFEFNAQLKEFIRKRDNYKCQNGKCGIPEKECFRKLDCHHIDYDKKNNDPINLIALCHDCHLRTNGGRDYWEKYYKQIQIDRKVHTLEKFY